MMMKAVVAAFQARKAQETTEHFDGLAIAIKKHYDARPLSLLYAAHLNCNNGFAS